MLDLPQWLETHFSPEGQREDRRGPQRALRASGQNPGGTVLLRSGGRTTRGAGAGAGGAAGKRVCTCPPRYLRGDLHGTDGNEATFRPHE